MVAVHLFDRSFVLEKIPHARLRLNHGKLTSGPNLLGELWRQELIVFGIIQMKVLRLVVILRGSVHHLKGINLMGFKLLFFNISKFVKLVDLLFDLRDLLLLG